MRKLIVQLSIFFVVVEWLNRVDIMILLATLGAGIAVLICIDLLLDSPQAR